MSSGKSTKAAVAVGRFQRLGFKVICVRPARSVRAHERGQPGRIVTKTGNSFPSTTLESAVEIIGLADGYDIVWIDEPMLFPDEGRLFEIIQSLRRTSKVIVSGLSATSEMEPFGAAMPRLLAVADEVTFCRSDCDRCGSFGTASRSLCLHRKDGQVLVGGDETYQAVCVQCWSAYVAESQATTS